MSKELHIYIYQFYIMHLIDPKKIVAHINSFMLIYYKLGKPTSSELYL